MDYSVECTFRDVLEHDMDLLFLEEFVCSTKFTKIFTDKAGIDVATVLSVHSSQTDLLLGESDITVVVETSNGEKVGLLIEDKIDAIAMPDQAERYNQRGEKGVENGDYNKFFVFIVAPKKYMLQNIESQQYPNKIEYETILTYFETLNEPRAQFKIQQIRQAIEKQKKGYQVEMDKAVTEFWMKYSGYQKKYYPGVVFQYNGEIKGSSAIWPRFETTIKGLYMYHKTSFGFIDLTFDKCADKIEQIEDLLTSTVGDYLNEQFTVHRTGKSAAVRLTVPKIDFHKPFENQEEDVKTCFDTIKKMATMAKRLPKNKVSQLIAPSK